MRSPGRANERHFFSLNARIVRSAAQKAVRALFAPNKRSRRLYSLPERETRRAPECAIDADCVRRGGGQLNGVAKQSSRTFLCRAGCFLYTFSRLASNENNALSGSLHDALEMRVLEHLPA